MADKTGIAWADATWNPLRGCSRVSAGCMRCYAERVAHRFSGKDGPYEGLTELTPKGPRWNGKIRYVEGALDQPLRWSRPRMIFVNSMSDLFHESVSSDYQDRIFDVMEDATHHIFQILTKRPERMRDYLIRRKAFKSGKEPDQHIWIGVSAENQETANERIPILMKTPASVRWVSAEPLLGPINFQHMQDVFWYYGEETGSRLRGEAHPKLNWVVVGGESGPNSRPMQRHWAENIVSQCQGAKVPVFVKQLGAAYSDSVNGIAGRTLHLKKETLCMLNSRLKDAKGGDIAEWPESLRIRQWPENFGENYDYPRL